MISTLAENCNPQEDNNTKLPYTAYLVWYKVDEETRYDLAMGDKQVDVFDAYYDKYKNVKGIEWTQGIVHPRTYDGQTKTTAPKKKAKRK